MERCGGVGATGIHVSTALKQQPRGIHVAIERRPVQRGLPGAVSVCSATSRRILRQELPQRIRVAALGSLEHRRHSCGRLQEHAALI